MEEQRRTIPWKKRLIQAAWILAGLGTIVLLGAAMQRKDANTCRDIRIEITGVDEHMFMDEKDILDLLNARRKVIGTPLSMLNLHQMEAALERNPWVRNAEIFVNNQQVLQVLIAERQPVARVFAQGSSFYVDSGLVRLPLSDKLTARVPMFTGFPSDNVVLSKPDSALLRDVVKLAQFIAADSFWSAQVAQIDIQTGHEFELVPVIGDHIVDIGSAADLEAKFRRLYAFYRQAWLQKGIHYYERINVQYNKQVVATRKGMGGKRFDSTLALQLIREMTQPDDPALQPMAAVAEKPKDSVVNMEKAAQPIQRPVKEQVPVKTVTNINNKKNTQPLSKKAKTNESKEKPANEGSKPKAVMGKKG